ncbi:MAG: DUF5688 family protein [Lachnospiraceae bacterium]
MELEQFVEKTRKALQDYYGKETQVIVNQVTKNNGIILHGLTIMPKDKNVAPTIYMNSFYIQYEEGTTFANLFKQITDVYEQSKPENDIDMKFFLDYKQAKKKIVYKLINYDKNRVLLDEIPHVKYLDLAIVFYYLFVHDAIGGTASILIRNSHCKSWQVSTEDIYADAKQNTPCLLKGEFINMETLIQELSGNQDSAIEEERMPMYILTNHSKMHGAACILYPDMVKQFSEQLGVDLYILPSSIHEVILVPVSKVMGVKELADMVQEVNETQVEEEEILSNHIYRYSREDESISKVS